MKWGTRFLIASAMLNASLIVALITFFDSSFLQTAANGIFGFIKDPAQRVYALAGLIIGAMVTIAALADSNIRGDEAEKYSMPQG